MLSDRTRLRCYATAPDQGSFTRRVTAAQRHCPVGTEQFSHDAVKAKDTEPASRYLCASIQDLFQPGP